jgi:hypothetical protein
MTTKKPYELRKMLDGYYAIFSRRSGEYVGTVERFMYDRPLYAAIFEDTVIGVAEHRYVAADRVWKASGR